MAEPRGQELVDRYRWNYGIAKDVPLTEAMILAHWSLEQKLTKELLESSPENRWETFERCYTTLYGELDWLNRLVGSASTTNLAERYRPWTELIGPSPKFIYEVGAGKGVMIEYLAQCGHQCTATESTRERGAKHVSTHANLRWTVTDGVHFGHFEPPETYDFVLSDNLIEHLHPNDLHAHLEGACEILKRGGQYLMAVPHRWFGPWDISKVFKHEIASGMHLKEYTHRELRAATLRAGFSEIRLVRISSPNNTHPYPASASRLRWVCLMETLFAPFAQPILHGRLVHMATRVGISPLVFLAAIK